MTMINLNIDGIEVKGHVGQTILEAARANGIEIPTLCHDERVKTYGACGLCVVEIEGAGRLARACATEINPGMIIATASERVVASRRTTLELLLSDHSGDCRPPCVLACPAQTDCQGYVGLIANGDYTESLKLIKEKIPLPACIGMVCPHPCEAACRRQLVEAPIAIAALKLFAAESDLAKKNPFIPAINAPTGKKAAIVGSGPAGLTAAYYLAQAGHEVIVYEAMPEPGGMLRYGIPEYRLPKRILDQEIDIIRAMGVKIIVNTKINQDISLDYLRSQNQAVFLGIGAWKSSRLGCAGEDLPGVVGGIDFLREAALNGKVEIGDRVAVIGGGNTAMDAARTAVRLGAKQTLVLYRRTREEMPAEDLEIHEAAEEGVEFRYLLAPDEIIAGDGKVAAIRMQKMQLGEPDASGRRKPIPIPGALETIEVDNIIAAIGQQVDLSHFAEIKTSRWYTIGIDDNTFMTNLPGVFAGGDAVTGPGIAIEAIAQGKKAADVMLGYLEGLIKPYEGSYLVERRDLTAESFSTIALQDRVSIPVQDPAVRRDNFQEISGRMSAEAAHQEASRCLECGCRDYFECKLINYANQYRVSPEYLQGEKHQQMEPDWHPFIERDAGKCILCGLCVRICDELMGINALGLVNRGFDTLVKPEFGLPLRDSACISCGQCVAVCPTGALLEKYPYQKNIPMQTRETSGGCSFCGIGCHQIASSGGELVQRIVPPVGQILCAKGRFGFGSFNQDRLRKPLIRVNGVLQETTWEEALTHVAKKSLALKSQYGSDAVAVMAAPGLTVEEASLAAYLGRDLLGTNKLGSFTPNAGRGLQEVFGANLSTNRLLEAEATDLILMVGSFNENQVMTVKIRNAVQCGAKLIIISAQSSLVDDIASLQVCPDNSTAFLKEILAASVANNYTDKHYIAKRTVGYESMAENLIRLVPGEEALKISALYGQSRKAMILVDGFTVSDRAVQLLADLALINGRIGSPRSGIVVVSAGGNANGLWQAGFRGDGRQLTDMIKTHRIKQVLILGEDPVGSGAIEAKALSELDFLVVLSPFMTATSELADVVLPASSPLETSGSYLSADNVKTLLLPAVSPPAGKDNLQILGQLIKTLSPGSQDMHRLGEKIANDLRWSQPVQFQKGFDFPDGLARLVWPADGDIFGPNLFSDPAILKFCQPEQV